MAKVIDENGNELEFIGGQWRPREDFITSMMPNPGGIVTGMHRGVSNAFEFAGLLEQSDERDRAFRERAARDPGSVLLGQGAAGFAAGLLPEAAAARGAAAIPRLGNFGRNVITSLAGGAGAATTVEGDPLQSFVEGAEQDIGISALIASGQAAFPMAARIMKGILGIRPARRKIEAGDTGEVSVELLEGVQGIGATDANPRGFEVTPAQASGITEELELEDSLRANPFRSGPFNAIDAANQKILNAEAARSIGLEDVNLIGKTAKRQAAENIGAEMDALVNQVGNMEVLPSDLDEFLTLADTVGIDNKTKNIITGHIETLTDAGNVTPKLYQSVRQKLTAAMMQANKVQGAGLDVGAFQSAIDAIDQLPTRTIARQGGDATAFLEEFGSAREKWRNLVAINGTGVVTPDGNVSPLRLNRQLEKVYGDTFRFGRVDEVRNEATGNLFSLTDAAASERLQFHRGGSPTARRQGAENAIETMAEGITSPEKAAMGILTGAFNIGSGPLHLSTPNSDPLNFILRSFGRGAATAALAENE